MKILILGVSALSHHLAQTLALDPNVEIIYHPGSNMPIEQNSYKYVPVSFDKQMYTTSKDLLTFILSTDIDLIVGVEHRYQLDSQLQAIIKLKKIPTVMPLQKIGMLEWSKITGKQFLNDLNIPTAPHKVFSVNELLQEFFNIPRPFVLKYDQEWRAGLQTVIITDENVHEQFEYLQNEGMRRISKVTANIGEQYFIVEDFIEGVKEYSYHVLCNSTSWTYLGCARDYKKRFDGDTGHNTASYGAYAIVDKIDPCIANYVDCILNKLKDQGTPYIGILYLGIMVTKDGTPVVLEINTRPGDPEFQVILPLIDESIASILYKCATNKPLTPIIFSNKKSVAVRIVHKDYNLSTLYEAGINYPMLWPVPDNITIGYSMSRGLLYCVITATGDTVKQAADIIYTFLKNKNMGDYTYRTDIGYLA
jgi:phosphoribosylamine-glycine ligase